MKKNHEPIKCEIGDTAASCEHPRTRFSINRISATFPIANDIKEPKSRTKNIDRSCFHRGQPHFFEQSRVLERQKHCNRQYQKRQAVNKVSFPRHSFGVVNFIFQNFPSAFSRSHSYIYPTKRNPGAGVVDITSKSFGKSGYQRFVAEVWLFCSAHCGDNLTRRVCRVGKF